MSLGAMIWLGSKITEPPQNCYRFIPKSHIKNDFLNVRATTKLPGLWALISTVCPPIAEHHKTVMAMGLGPISVTCSQMTELPQTIY